MLVPAYTKQMTHSPTNDDLNPEAVLAQLAQCRQPFLIGVRHHSAAMAKVIPQLLDQFAPEIILLELPPEFSEWIPWLAHPETQAPVALSGCDLDGRQLSFYPFADFSPELAAIRWAAQNDVPVEAFDLPVGDRVHSRREAVKKLGQAPRNSSNVSGNGSMRSEPVPFFYSLRGYRTC